VVSDSTIRAMLVSYRLSIVTVALSVAIQPQFAIECLQRSNQEGWVTFCGIIWGGRVDPCKSNFNTIWERDGAVGCKRIYAI